MEFFAYMPYADLMRICNSNLYVAKNVSTKKNLRTINLRFDLIPLFSRFLN